MTRTSKQAERRAMSPRKHRTPGVKTGSKKDNLPKGYREHSNAIDADLKETIFVGKVK